MNLLKEITRRLPLSLAVKESISLKAFGFTQIRAILFANPRVVYMDDEVTQVIIPLNWRTRNHLNCMYIGVLVAGADIAGGILAMNRIKASGKKVALLFKSFHADFLKRAEGDVLFTCKDGQKMTDLVHKAVETKQRVEDAVEVIATVPTKLGDEPVAKFQLTITLKEKA